MQIMTFNGRLAADPQISEDGAKAVFRLIEKRGVDGAGKDRLVGVNCVSWSKGLNEKVIGPGLEKGCEAVVVGAFVDTTYTARDGTERSAKELVINRLTVLDWAEGREAGDASGPGHADERGSGPDAGSGASPARPRSRRRAAA